MENCGFGWQNRVLDAGLTASAQASSLPVINLRNQQGAESLGWRVLGTSAVLTLRLPALGSWRGFSLHRTNLSAAASLSVTVLSGGSPVWQGAAQGTANAQIVLVSPSSVSGDSVTMQIDDPANPDGYLSIPLAYAGPLWQPARNYSTDSTSGCALGADSTTTLGGAEFVDSRWYQRKLSIVHQSYGDADAAVLTQILRAAATGQNILFLPDPAASLPKLCEAALFGRLSGGDLSNPFGVADRHALTLTHTERL